MRDKRTAELWLLYLEMVEILLSFIKSDMIGNWQLHLKIGQQLGKIPAPISTEHA